MHESLFTPVRFGAFELSSRIVMAPMTRDRAGPDDVPTDLMVEYYRQRASAGLIVTEGVQPKGKAIGARPAYGRSNRSMAGRRWQTPSTPRAAGL
jgi:N-ethylmaleimide reductase